MFKYQNTEMGVEPSLILESRCSALSSQCQVPECLRFQMFPTWQISRTLVQNGKSIVNPQIHASCDFASKLVCCLLRGFVWETMLLAGEAGVHSVNRHAKCCPVKQDIHQKTVYEKVPQDLWWPKLCEAIDIWRAEVLGNPWFLASASLQHHQAQHKSSNMHKLLENKAEGHRESLLGMLPPNETTPQTAYRNFIQ